MRDVYADIAAALGRCGSPVTVDEVWAALFRGDLVLCIGDQMTASAWDRDGPAEIVHIAGRWNRADAVWMRATFRNWALARGKPPVWFGRKGWERFLRLRGFDMDQRG